MPTGSMVPPRTRASRSLRERTQRSLDLRQRAESMARLPPPVVPLPVGDVGEEPPPECPGRRSLRRTCRAGSPLFRRLPGARAVLDAVTAVRRVGNELAQGQDAAAVGTSHRPVRCSTRRLRVIRSAASMVMVVQMLWPLARPAPRRRWWAVADALRTISSCAVLVRHSPFCMSAAELH